MEKLIFEKSLVAHNLDICIWKNLILKVYLICFLIFCKIFEIAFELFIFF